MRNTKIDFDTTAKLDYVRVLSLSSVSLSVSHRPCDDVVVMCMMNYSSSFQSSHDNSRVVQHSDELVHRDPAHEVLIVQVSSCVPHE